MTEHHLIQKVTPICPDCDAVMDSAGGPSTPPKDGDYAICAYCACISQYKAVPGGFVFEKVDIDSFEGEERNAFYTLQEEVKKLIS